MIMVLVRVEMSYDQFYYAVYNMLEDNSRFISYSILTAYDIVFKYYFHRKLSFAELNYWSIQLSINADLAAARELCMDNFQIYDGMPRIELGISACVAVTLLLIDDSFNSSWIVGSIWDLSVQIFRVIQVVWVEKE